MTTFAASEAALRRPFIEKRPLERYAAPAQPSLVGMSREALAAGAGRGRRAGTAAPHARAADLALALCARRARFRRDDDAVEGAARGAGAALYAGAAAKSPPSRSPSTARANGFSGLPGEPADAPHEVECVYIPETDRGTLCISSQVGCTLNCTFCHTGTQRLVRNLTAAEIAGQVVVGARPAQRLARAAAPAPAREPEKRLVSNVVMMGMGEPLYNFEAVRDGLDVIADGDGLSISKRRITLSTSGVVPNIARAGAEIGSMLAVSLHAVTDELRDQLVPLNRKYPLRELLEACRNYPGLSNARRITFEYVMLKGVNDSLADAKALVRLLKGIPAKINLIPFNPWPGTTYECSDWEQIEKFSEIVFDAGYASPVRTPRGRDILAACGQLKSATEKLSARERLALRAMAMTD